MNIFNSTMSEAVRVLCNGLSAICRAPSEFQVGYLIRSAKGGLPFATWLSPPSMYVYMLTAMV